MIVSRMRVLTTLHRRALVVSSCLATGLLVVASIRVARAQPGPPTLGVGSIVSTSDSTSETFVVFRALNGAPPNVRGTVARVTIVDHPGEADYAITGKVTGAVELENEPPRFRHAFTLELKVWAHGAKVGTTTAHCEGSATLNPAPPDYRYEALLPCVRNQLPALVRLLDEH